jgi:hypothetical protein
MNKPVQVYMDHLELERLESWARERGWGAARHAGMDVWPPSAE